MQQKLPLQMSGDTSVRRDAASHNGFTTKESEWHVGEL